MSRRWELHRRAGSSVLAAVVLCWTVGITAVGYASEPTPSLTSAMSGSPPYLVLTASTLDAVGLTYVGTFTVSRPSSDVQVLRFRMTSGWIGDMSLTQACTAGDTTTVTTADTASLEGVTFDAVSFALTVGGTPLTFTSANPPSQPFPNEVMLEAIALTGTTVVADALHLPSFTTEAATC